MQESIYLKFSYRPRDKGAKYVLNDRRQTLSSTDGENKMNMEFIYMALGWFSLY